MIAALAENHLAYRGKLKDMCEFLGVSNATNNTKKIKSAIEALENSGDIKVIRDGHTWTLTLSVKAEKKSKIIKIKRAWFNLIKNFKADDKDDAVAWENILKVLVYLSADKTEIKNYTKIACDLGIGTRAVERSVKALDGIEFGDIELKRKLAWFKNQDDEFRVAGQKIDIKYKFC